MHWCIMFQRSKDVRLRRWFHGGGRRLWSWVLRGFKQVPNIRWWPTCMTLTKFVRLWPKVLTETKSSLCDFDHLSEPDVDLENQYYNSKSLKEKDPKAALESFQRVLDLENGEKGKYFGRLYLNLHFCPRRVGFQSLEANDQNQLSAQ